MFDRSIDVYSEIHHLVLDVLQGLVQERLLVDGVDYSLFNVETERSGDYDLAVNAALIFARCVIQPNPTKPDWLAQIIVGKLKHNHIETLTTKRGFINITLKASSVGDLARSAANICSQPTDRSNPVLIEYVSANPTGPLHVGHARGAVVGDVVANLLAFTGKYVKREYYVNDAGKQIDVLARSAFYRYLQFLGEEATAPDDFYPGDYLIPFGKVLANHYGRSMVGRDEGIWRPYVSDLVVAAMMTLIQEDLRMLGIRHDAFFHEKCLVYDGAPAPTNVMKLRASTVESAVEETVRMLREDDFVYDGILVPPKGEVDPDWSEKTMTLFRSTQFGDDVDRVLLRADGSHTYFANDMTYHRDKVARGFRTLINVWGADHSGYVKRMTAAVAAVSKNTVNLEILLCQMVRLARKGKLLRILTMSKRSGNYVMLRELIDEVGKDAIRFMMIYRSHDTEMDFDLEDAKAQSKDNPVYYVQYAHARACSVFRKAEELIEEFSKESLQNADMTRLDHPDEKALLRKLMAFPRTIDKAAEAREPHRLAFYLHDLASAFHSYWQVGSTIVDPDALPLTYARVAMVSAIHSALRTGLGIIGVSAPEAMERRSVSDPSPYDG